MNNFALRNIFCPIVCLIVSVSVVSCGGGGGGGGSGSANSGSDSGTLSASTQQAIDAAVIKSLDAYGENTSVPGAAVGVWVPGQGSYVKGYGKSDLAGNVDMGTDLHVRVASITKSFVVTVILQLVDEGKLTLDDTVDDFHLGVTVPEGDRITIRELCNMTSGLFDIYHSPKVDDLNLTPYTHISPEKVIDVATDSPSYFAPGAGWYYSDTNYFILGLIIEKVTGTPLDAEVRNRLIVPLGLSQTTFPTDDPAMPAPYVHGYEPDSSSNWKDETITYPPSFFWGAGAMISNMNDLKTWVQAFVTGTTNSAATQKERLTCVKSTDGNEKFGLGVVCTGGWYGYTGGITGYNSSAFYLPSTGATIVVLVNSVRPRPYPGVASSMVRDIAKTITPGSVPFE